MKISKEEIVHIANLANLNIKDEEIDNYILHLQDILNFANIVNVAEVANLPETVGSIEKVNAFRKDEIVEFEDKEALMENARNNDAVEQNMFMVP